MKRILPILLFVFVLFGGILISPPEVSYGQANPAPVPTGGLWVVDPEVTFIGKNAARAGHTLNWTLLNYQWSCVQKSSGSNCDNSDNPLSQFWQRIVFFVVAPMLILVILVTSAVIIITRGKSLTIMRFIPRFVAILVLIAFSYSLLQFLYQFFDLIQGFFLRTDITKSCPPSCIQDSDLLYVGWSYQDFVGLRLLGDYNAESAFMSLLLTKLTALTYFVMVGILLIRKIILWFFIIISPIFPILLMYYPIRNTGKIWVGEFFRWLLYGPLFAIFLQGLVFMWRFQGQGGGGGIPLQFLNPGINNASNIVYPTAVNILLGGPQQFVTPNNSVNLPETFMLYVVSLIMLWIVILLPWILLQIFLDYAANFSPGGNAALKSFMNKVSNKMVPPSPSPASPSQPGGVAINLPFAKRNVNIPIMPMPGGAAKTIIRETQQEGVARPINAPLAQISAQVMSLADIPLPTMRDIARYDTASLSNNMNQKEEVSRMQQTLEKIANPVAVTSTIERERYTNMKERLAQESKQGNVIATSIMNAVNSAANNQSRKNTQVSTTQLSNILQQIANPASTKNLVDRERMTNLREMLSRERDQNNSQLASTLLSVTDRTSSNEIEKIRESLMQAKQQANPVATPVLNQILSGQKDQSTKELRTVLSQIANPSLVTNNVDREKMSKLHEALQKEGQQNNNMLAQSILQVDDKTTTEKLDKIREQLYQSGEDSIASSVLSQISSTQKSSQSTKELRTVLSQIANPSQVTNNVDREKLSKLHDYLQKEGQQNNNMLAQSILQVNDKTTAEKLDKIREQLYQSGENAIASSVLSTINTSISKQQESVRVKSVLQQVANPAIASAVDKEKINRLHEALKSASQNGDELATSILSVSTKTSSSEMEKLQDKLNMAKVKGESIAKEVLDIAAKEGAEQIPSSNRIQSVTQEELDDVKRMWKDNYNNLEVPQGVTGDRSEWIKGDIEKIDSIINNLSSNDQDRINEGIQEVSNILPFLLVGGFSQSDIVSYLTVKQEAAKEVLQAISIEEETKVTVETRHATASQTMTATIEEPTVSAPAQTFETTNIITPQVSNEILAMVNFKLPRMRDIARFEAMRMSKDKSQYIDVQKTKEILEKIANPSTAINVTEREKYEKLHEKLIEEGEKGNATAVTILSAAGSTSQRTVKNVFSQIANPETAIRSKDKERFSRLHDQLLKASQEGNELATSILGVKETTEKSDIEELNQKLNESKGKGESLAVAIADVISEPVTLPTETRLQEVTQDDLNDVKEMWKENYSNMEVPEGVSGTRAEWIKEDIERIEDIVSLMSSTNQSEINEGISKVSNILPFLLAGGFSQSDIISYLNVKKEAAQEILESITKEEETKVTVDTKSATVSQAMTASVEEPTANAPIITSEPASIVTPETSNEIFTMVNLKLPRMVDIARFETMSLARDKSKAEELQKVKEILENISSTEKVQIPEEREKMEKLRQHLLEESKKGNNMADSILKAADSYSKNADEIATAVPDDNKIQTVSQDDYDEVRKMWEENYRTLPVPLGFNDDNQGRIDWIKRDSEEIQGTIDLLKSEDVQKRNEGISKVSSILPFLLLGGFSYQEITGYLNVKIEAAKTVLNELTKSEESEVKVDVDLKTHAAQEEKKEMAD